MKCIEPSPGLVHTFSNKVRREALPECFLILKREVPLCIRHRSAVKPNVYQIRYAFHWFARRAYQDDLVHIRFVQIKNALMEIVFVYITTQYFIRLADAFIQLFDRADTNFFIAIFCLPDRERCSPETAAAQVPVNHVLQPVAKAAFTG